MPVFKQRRQMQHPCLPAGICRLFPLGRLYENRSFSYFLQIHECKKPGRAKIRVKKWIDTPEPETYDSFISEWHYFLKDMAAAVRESGNEQAEKAVNMYILKKFYFEPYPEPFYEEIGSRIEKSEASVSSLKQPLIILRFFNIMNNKTCSRM